MVAKPHQNSSIFEKSPQISSIHLNFKVSQNSSILLKNFFFKTNFSLTFSFTKLHEKIHRKFTWVQQKLVRFSVHYYQISISVEKTKISSILLDSFYESTRWRDNSDWFYLLPMGQSFSFFHNILQVIYVFNCLQDQTSLHESANISTDEVAVEIHSVRLMDGN